MQDMRSCLHFLRQRNEFQNSNDSNSFLPFIYHLAPVEQPFFLPVCCGGGGGGPTFSPSPTAPCPQAITCCDCRE